MHGDCQGDERSDLPIVHTITLYVRNKQQSRFAGDPRRAALAGRRGRFRLGLLGRSHPELNGCDHPHLLRLAPYEE